jgi:hypothetical protein
VEPGIAHDHWLVLEPIPLRFRRRPRLARDRRVERSVGRFQVAFHQHGRDLEGLRDGIEPMSGGVFRQEVLEADIDGQQLADRILVLRAIEPTQDDPALTPLPVRFPAQVPFDPGDDGRDIGRHRTWLLLRRHLPGPELSQHLGPGLPRSRAGELGRKQVESQIRFLHIGTVTIRAVLRDERTDGRFVGRLVRRRSARPGQSESGRDESPETTGDY